MEVCGDVTDERGELSKSSSNIVVGVSGNKPKKGRSHHFASKLSNISGRGASCPGIV